MRKQLDQFDSDDIILLEVGHRIKAERIRSSFTQESLAEKSGVSKSTIERLEKGETVQFINLVKVFRALNLLHSLEVLIPSYEPTPMEYLEVREPNKMQRYYPKKNKKQPFKWGDEQ